MAAAGAADDALLAYTRVLDRFPDAEAARQGAGAAVVQLRVTQELPPDIRPPLPAHLAELLGRQERFTVVANDQAAIERFIRDKVDAGRALKSAS